MSSFSPKPCPACGELVLAKQIHDCRTRHAPDPWAHRSQGMRCRTCMWFALKVESKPSGNPGALGRCRRHAPNQAAIGWPAVFETDWCGDHKLDETKL